jgi:hypothetical protein
MKGRVLNMVEMNVKVTDTKVDATLGDGSKANCDVDLKPLDMQTIRVFQEWLKNNSISTVNELQVLGHFLYKALFNGRVETLFEKVLDQAMSEKEEGQVKGGRLRVRLSFHEDATELAGLPWEYLFYPNRRTFFFATGVDLVLMRYMEFERPTPEFTPVDGPLRILLVISQPKDLTPVNATPIVDALEGLEQRKLVVVDQVSDLRIDNFIDELLARNPKPHILHFVGHAKYDNYAKKAVIALPGPNQEPVWLSDYDLREYFDNMRWSPRLVFFYLSHIGENKDDQLRASFSGLERELFLANVQAVVALQYPISDFAAKTFSRAFYEKLALGEPIDEAVQEGRFRLVVGVPGARYSRMIGTPVLYATNGGNIIKPSQTVPTGTLEQRSRQTTATSSAVSTPDTYRSEDVGEI